jgi:hypothetical protein
MDKIDPQVQVRIIDLAAKWSDETRDMGRPSEDTINRQDKLFDKAYKAIVKTVSGQ